MVSGRSGSPPFSPIEEAVKRTNGAIHGNEGLDAGDARERLVPGITLETRLGGEQLERAFQSALEPGKAEGAMERLGLGRLRVGLHHQNVGAYRLRRRTARPNSRYRQYRDARDAARRGGSGISIPASFALCQSVQATRGAGSACAMAR